MKVTLKIQVAKGECPRKGTLAECGSTIYAVTDVIARGPHYVVALATPYDYGLHAGDSGRTIYFARRG